jgi:hypothetical protein
LRTTTSLSLRAGTTTRGSGAAIAPVPHGLLLAMFAQVLGVVGDVETEPVSRTKIHILVCDVSNLAILDHQPSFRILAPGVRLPLRVRLLLGITL